MKIAAKVKLLLLCGLVSGTIYFGGNAEAQYFPFTPFVDWNPNGEFLAVGSGTTLEILNSNTLEVMNRMNNLAVQESSSAWSPDGNKLAIINGPDVEIWEYPWDEALANRLLTYGSYNYFNPPLQKQDVIPVAGLVWSPNGTEVAVVLGVAIDIVESETGRRVRQLFGEWGNVPDLDWSVDDRLVLANWDQFAYIIDPSSGNISNYFFTGHFSTLTSSVSSVAFSPNGDKLAVGTSDGVVVLWNNTQSAEYLEETPDLFFGSLSSDRHSEGVNALAWSNTGQYLASGSQDGTIRFWDVVTGELLEVISLGEDAWVYSIAWSPDGTKLAYGKPDGTVEIITFPSDEIEATAEATTAVG
jgi:WD40 repeat protein